MGTWGVDTFENDTACDWAFGLEEAQNLDVVRSTLQAVVDSEEFLDCDPACEALAACEVIARLKGHPGVRDSYTEPVDQWVEAHLGTPPDVLSSLAVAAIDRIFTEPSELLSLWSETADVAAWKASVTDLRTRVSA